MPDFVHLNWLIRTALEEDRGLGDVTSEITVPADRQGLGQIVFREGGILCGMAIIPKILHAYDERLALQVSREDGRWVTGGECVGTIRGPLPSLFTAERVVLNFLQRLSGIATFTSRFVQAVAGTAAGIFDTRKTTPGWRELEKYAVCCGGGRNHRQGLHDAVLIKDNHLEAMEAENLTEALREALKRVALLEVRPQFIEVEVDTLEQLDQVLEVEGVDIVLLDNMLPEQMREAVTRRNDLGLSGRVQLEASGGVTLETVRSIAQTGVERISVGALTHSAVALDIGLDLKSK